MLDNANNQQHRRGSYLARQSFPGGFTGLQLVKSELTRKVRRQSTAEYDQALNRNRSGQSQSVAYRWLIIQLSAPVNTYVFIDVSVCIFLLISSDQEPNLTSALTQQISSCGKPNYSEKGDVLWVNCRLSCSTAA